MMENAEEITFEELEEHFYFFMDEVGLGKCFIVTHPNGRVALVPAELTTDSDSPQ